MWVRLMRNKVAIWDEYVPSIIIIIIIDVIIALIIVIIIINAGLNVMGSVLQVEPSTMSRKRWVIELLMSMITWLSLVKFSFWSLSN